MTTLIRGADSRLSAGMLPRYHTLTAPGTSAKLRPVMRLLCILSGGADHPSSRFRILQHLPALRDHGLAIDTFVAKKRSLADLWDLRRRAAAADALLIQKKLFPVWKVRPLLG